MTQTTGRKAELEIGNQTVKFVISDVAAWSEVATEVIRHLEPGTILAIQGDLGAGKTTFIQTLAKELGVQKFVPSPTFALMRSYAVKGQRGLKRLIHVDAYRIENPHELLALDLDEELADGQSALVLEWPEKIEAWLARRPHATLKIKTRP